MKEHQVGTFVWCKGLVGYCLTDRIVVLHDFWEGAFLPGTTFPIPVLDHETIIWILDPEEWEE